MKRCWPAVVLSIVAALCASAAWSQQQITCESRNYQQQFCPAGVPVAQAWVVYQRSKSPCIQGQSWGYQGNGIWVDQGCAADFSYRGYGPPPVVVPQPAMPAARTIVCESLNYEAKVCSTGQPVIRAWLVAQRSRSPCIQGQSWGFETSGIWVMQGCQGEFGWE